jgi:hypothetical protein
LACLPNTCLGSTRTSLRRCVSACQPRADHRVHVALRKRNADRFPPGTFARRRAASGGQGLRPYDLEMTGLRAGGKQTGRPPANGEACLPLATRPTWAKPARREASVPLLNLLTNCSRRRRHEMERAVAGYQALTPVARPDLRRRLAFNASRQPDSPYGSDAPGPQRVKCPYARSRPDAVTLHRIPHLVRNPAGNSARSCETLEATLAAQWGLPPILPARFLDLIIPRSPCTPLLGRTTLGGSLAGGAGQTCASGGQGLRPYDPDVTGLRPAPRRSGKSRLPITRRRQSDRAAAGKR